VRLISRFLVAACVVVAGFAAATPAAAVKSVGPVRLYLVLSDASEPSYLFGTYYSAHPRVLDVLDEVQEAFQRCTVLATEFTGDWGTFGIAAMFLPVGQDLGDFLDDETLEAVLYGMERRGVERPFARRVQLWAAAQTLWSPPPGQDTDEYALPLEDRILLMALAAGKRHVELETGPEAFGPAARLPIDDQIAMVRTALNDDLDYFDGAMTQAYLDGDLERLVGLLTENDPPMAEDAKTRFLDASLYARQRLWMKRLAPLLDQGGVFVSVGAMHLYGEKGLIARLKRAGYEVIPLRSKGGT